MCSSKVKGQKSRSQGTKNVKLLSHPNRQCIIRRVQ